MEAKAKSQEENNDAVQNMKNKKLNEKKEKINNSTN